MPSHAISKKTRFPLQHTARQWLITLCGSLGTVFWYALPDFVTTRKARFFARFATLLGLGGLSGVIVSDTVDKVREDITRESPDEEAWEMTSDNVKFSRANFNLPMLFLLFVLGGGFALGAIWTEFWLFRRGERRRLSGIRLAHTRQAIPLGLLFAAGYLIDDSLSN